MKPYALFLAALLSLSCTSEPEPLELPALDLSGMPIIPMPREVENSPHSFALHAATRIAHDPGFEKVASQLENHLAETMKLNLGSTDDGRHITGIYFRKAHDSLADNDEAYEIRIGRDSLVLFSRNPEAAFRGLQTLKQIFTVSPNDSLAAYPVWPVPGGRIRDYPAFSYRGTMLDVSRHFFSVAEVKRYIELLAYYKINYLHLHLSDDQGWRIEIKSWPDLAQVGGKTEVGGGPGGYYTQAEFAELVAFAKAHHIEIIPEIDMPGHTNAASVAYPILNGAKKPARPYHGTRVGFSTLDTRKDTVYQFIDDVVRELSAISPSPYFHIGGDESHVTRDEDYRYFVERVQDILHKHGKRMVGWDEIATADIDSTAIAQYWNREANARLAVSKNMKVLLSPAKKAYLDMKYDSLSKHGLDWAGHIPLDSAYQWSPESYAKGVPLTQILGLEAPLWSETISDSAELEYLAFPRIIAYAELAWTPESRRSWDSFRERLAGHQAFLDRNEVNYYRSPAIRWEQVQLIDK